MTETKEQTTTEGITVPRSRRVSISEAAEMYNVTRQAIYVAIKNKKLKAKKSFNRWRIDVVDLEEYRGNRYSRARSTHNGELLFDNSKGMYSVNQIAKMLNVSPQKIYYAARVGLLKAARRGGSWVLHIDDVKEYKHYYLRRRRIRVPAETIETADPLET